MVEVLPLKVGVPLTRELPAGQMLPCMICAQTAVGLSSSYMLVGPRQAVSFVIFHSGVPCVPG